MLHQRNSDRNIVWLPLQSCTGWIIYVPRQRWACKCKAGLSNVVCQKLSNDCKKNTQPERNTVITSLLPMNGYIPTIAGVTNCISPVKYLKKWSETVCSPSGPFVWNSGVALARQHVMPWGFFLNTISSSHSVSCALVWMPRTPPGKRPRIKPGDFLLLWASKQVQMAM